MGCPSNDKKSTKRGISKFPDGLGRKEKARVGPGLMKEMKKGKWTRITNRPKSDLMEEASIEVDGPKHKARELLVHENSNTKKEKKQKTKEETKKQSTLFTTQLGSAEVAKQLRREL